MNKIIERHEKTRFVCTRCGLCCSSGPNVALTVYDICRIAKYLNKSWRELAGRYFYVVIADQFPVAVLRGINNKCVFLESNGKITYCTIYPARPVRCRMYPFIPVAPRELNKYEVSSRCPGVGRGDVIDPPWSELEKYSEEVTSHYSELFSLIFVEGYDPLRALEILLDKTCSSNS